MANHRVAPRQRRTSIFSLCPRASSCCTARFYAQPEPAGRMAADRVAQRRTGADQILALDPSRRYRLSTPGRTRQTTLADRARLSGAQARGRARAFRRPRMARLSSSRHAVHRRLRLPGLREGDDSPLRLSSRQAVQDTCRSQRLPTQRLRRCEPNDTLRTRLRQPDCA